MSDENPLFQSSMTFDDVDEIPAPTPDSEYEASFEKGLKVDDEPIKPEPAKQVVAGFTDDELREAIAKAKKYDDLEARLTKTHDTAFGKMGNLEQELRSLKQMQFAPVQPPQLSENSFESLNGLLGDTDFGKALAADLSKIQLGSAPVVNQGLTPDAYKAELDGLRQQFEEKLVSIAHPDWREIPLTPEYKAWYESLDDNSKIAIDTSYKSEDVTQALNQFKAWRNKKSDAEMRKQKRLENAIPLQSGGRARSNSNVSYESGFQQGFKKVNG